MIDRTVPTTPSPSLSASELFALGVESPLESLIRSIECLGSTSVDPAERDRALDTAKEQVRRLSKNVRELFDQVHGSANPTRPCPISGIQAEALAGLSPSQRSRVLCVCDGEIHGSIEVDPVELSGALGALLNNALEASSGPVLCTTSAGRGALRFAVVDAAPKFAFSPVEAREPFTTNKPGHLGLGLSLAQRSVERAGGRLEIGRSEFGVTTATIELPVPQGSAR